MASRPDLLPSEYLDELQKLQDGESRKKAYVHICCMHTYISSVPISIPQDVPTFSNEIAFRIVEEELNQKFGDVFELVEPEPVAGMYQCLLTSLNVQCFYRLVGSHVLFSLLY